MQSTLVEQIELTGEFCPRNLYEFVRDLDGFTDSIIQKTDQILDAETMPRVWEE